MSRTNTTTRSIILTAVLLILTAVPLGHAMSPASPAADVILASDCSGLPNCYTTLADALSNAGSPGTVDVQDTMVLVAGETITDQEVTLFSTNGSVLLFVGSGDTMLAAAGSARVTIDGVGLADISGSANTGVAAADTAQMTVSDVRGAVSVSGFATTAAVNGTGTVILKGSEVDATNGTLFSVNAAGATAVAYANNVTGGNLTAVSNPGGGSVDLGHNWWGSHTDNPNNSVPAGDWAQRLGADIVAWSEGSGNASLGSASLAGGSGTAVIVDHGDPAALADAPFGAAVAGFYDDMCSNYYDFFVGSGATGSWTVTVPVDNNAGCNVNVRDEQKLFMIGDAAQCAATPRLCWDLVTANISTVNQTLEVTGMTPAELSGTGFVAGSRQDAYDPTAVSLQSVAGSGPAAGMLAPLTLVLLLATVAVAWRWRRAARRGPA